MRRCQQYTPHTGAVDHVAPDEVGVLLAQPNTLLWVDLEAPTTEELAWLHETFRFHPLAMEDIVKQQQRAKLDTYEDYILFVFHTPQISPDALEIGSNELDVFMGSNFLVTVHHTPIPSLEQVHHRWEQYRLPHEAAPYLFYLIADGIVDSYFPVVDLFGDQIEEVDTLLFTEPGTDMLQRIFTMRRNLMALRKTLGPLRDALNELLRIGEHGELFSVEQSRAYFNDVFDHVLRLTDFVDTYRDMLSGSLEAYQSAVSNKINHQMQLLTVVTTILATSTVITGFYGMNLQGLLINSGWPYGGHLILGILFVVTLGEIWFFRRQGWI